MEDLGGLSMSSEEGGSDGDAKPDVKTFRLVPSHATRPYGS